MLDQRWINRLMNKNVSQYRCIIILLAFFVLLSCKTQNVKELPNSVETSIPGQAVLFNDNWQFSRHGTALVYSQFAEVENWEEVIIPHTAKVEPKIVNDQWQGIAWYKKTFQFNPLWKGKNVFLKFEGAMNETRVWLNGKELAFHRGGYLPFTAELNKALLEGENLLVVGLDNRDNPITGPKPLEILDFNMYGGLYRDVLLRVENAVYISDPVHANEVAGGGIFVTYPLVSEKEATLNIKTHVKSTKNHSDITVKQTLYRDNTVVAQVTSAATVLNAKHSKHVELAMPVKNPDLWSPRNPALYKLITQVFSNNELMDQEHTRIGIRNIDVKPGKFTINGEEMFLRGVNRHQEYPYVGYAISKQANYRDAVRIKSAGFDYVRLSHYPHSPSFIRAADELGLILLDAILGWQYIKPEKEFQEHAWQTCRDMIRRDRNHPSIFAWECSLNESWMENMEPFVEKMNDIVHEEFPGENVYSVGWVDYGYDIYLQARQHRIEHYEPPTKPYIVSEYGDWEYYALNAGLNQDAWNDLKEEERTSRQLLQHGEARLLQQATNVQEAHNDNFNVPAIADGYWVMFDYNRGYADDLEASGIMSIDRLPKFSYYFFQSQRDPNWSSDHYSAGPMVHIANYWQQGSSTEVRIFSNAEEVELILNGKSLGKIKPAATTISNNIKHPPFIFSLPKYEPGLLVAKAYINGKMVAEHKRETSGPAKSITLSTDAKLGGAKPSAGDTVFVYAQLRDEAGRPVHTSGQEVEFTNISGVKFLGPKTHLTEGGIASALVRIESDASAAKVGAKFGDTELQVLEINE